MNINIRRSQDDPRKKKASRGKENRRSPASGKLPNRPKKHRRWSEESMIGAMNAV